MTPEPALWAFGTRPKGDLRADWQKTPAGEQQGAASSGPPQELGTIEAGSKVEITASWKA